ncbi:hypothetical protein MLD38_026772 [Melastoma candidum]|uniref:Uncharacterized protein n=1 Tax=Melastoma candidum TaxID=119954 RepID=A0ACB9NZM0_9MYRT|nr:hypothetical protein MLD38_026772 [Melastoma candidum]
MSEWAAFRSLTQPNGWSARGGQGKNPYVLSADPCGSSSGSAISVAANLVAVSLGTETDGSILCPASANSVVGIKPTVGLTSRAGVVPLTPRQDTIGPITRTVADAVCVLEVIAGYDYKDAEATKAASQDIPKGGYLQFLKADGLRGKRIGIVRDPFFNFTGQPDAARAYQNHFQTLRDAGAVLVDNLKIDNIDVILDFYASGEELACLAEFKIALNNYLKSLVSSPVRSLADVIAFNNNNVKLELTDTIDQSIFLLSQATNGIGSKEKLAIQKMAQLTHDGFLKLISQYRLDAVMAPGSAISPVLAIGGFPGINVPAGYDSTGVPFGVSFGGLKGSEPKLIEIANGFEQATKVRKPPSNRNLQIY